MSEKDYEVGYGKPPKHTRFKKGAPSPNPSGRPKNEVSFIRSVKECLAEPVNVTTSDGKQVQMSTAKVISKKLVNKAAGGQISAQRLIFDMERRTHCGPQQPTEPVSEEEDATPEDVEAFAKDIFRALQSARPPERSCFFDVNEDGLLEPTALGRPLMDLDRRLTCGQVRDVEAYRAALETAFVHTKRAMDAIAFGHLKLRIPGLKESDLN